MAEYYPLLAKAVGSLPNSTPDSRRVVYERARKALIGQLRTLHPPVPDDDIERESVALDRAIERLESELANGGIPAPAIPAAPAPAPKAPEPTKPTVKPAGPPVAPGGATGSTEKRPVPPAPLRTKVPKPSVSKPPVATPVVLAPDKAAPPAPINPTPLPVPAGPTALTPAVPPEPPVVTGPPVVEASAVPPLPDENKRLKPPRSDPQRPIAPQPPMARGPKRRLWIIPVVVGLVFATVGFAAWKLRDHPETIAKGKPADPTQAESGKIAERVGGPPTTPVEPSNPAQPSNATDQPTQQADSGAPATNNSQQQPASAPANPDLPVAHRAALLVEAPDEPNKVKTFLGTVVWKLNNVPQGPNDSVGLAVEADVDLPDDKMKAVITFAKNTEASLPASHTINIRFSVGGGSLTGDVKQISVPQMRPESSPSGEPLAGVTVQIVPNSFLVGLSPGNAEAANTDLIRRLQWIDIPILLDNGKIAKLTFEKSDSGQRDLNEALDAWAKQ